MRVHICNGSAFPLSMHHLPLQLPYPKAPDWVAVTEVVEVGIPVVADALGGADGSLKHDWETSEMDLVIVGFLLAFVIHISRLIKTYQDDFGWTCISGISHHKSFFIGSRASTYRTKRKRPRHGWVPQSPMSISQCSIPLVGTY